MTGKWMSIEGIMLDRSVMGIDVVGPEDNILSRFQLNRDPVKTAGSLRTGEHYSETLKVLSGSMEGSIENTV